MAFLHDLGAILHFPDPNLEATNILSPDWVTSGVYRILNWHLEGGVLPFHRLQSILDLAEYPPRQHLFIIGMMKKFELCFEFESSQPPTYLIPDLLPKSEPDTGDWGRALRFQYHYEVLPSSVISRFIVRMSHFVSKQTYWRNGVVIAKGGNRALVKADLEDRRVFISVSGRPSDRRSLMDIIRAEFDRIHATIPQLPVQEKVPMPDDPSVLADYEHLLNLLDMGEVSFVPEGTKTRYNVRDLLEGIESEERREERREDRLDLRDRRSRVSPPAAAPESALSLWQAGALLLILFVICVIVFSGSAYILGGPTFSLIAIGTVLVIAIISVFALRAGGMLSERNTVALAEKTLNRLSLLRKPTPAEPAAEPGGLPPSRRARANSPALDPPFFPQRGKRPS